jgi:tripartite ATP-independent transporter DctP family solute receptor
MNFKQTIRLTSIAAATWLAIGSASAQTIVKIGYTSAANGSYGMGVTAFCDEIEKGTQGRYKCQQFPAGSVGGEREMIEAVQLGTLDITDVSTGPVGNFVPEVKIVDIPFLFRDYDHARAYLDGPNGQELLKKFPAKGLIALTWSENGFRHMTNNKHPIVTPADTAGLKMRTMENKVHMDGYRTFGIRPTPMAFPEVFGALQQGIVDGQENPIPIILSSKFSQVQKYLSLTAHVYSPALFLTSPRFMNKLSEADKKVFYDAAKVGNIAQRKKVSEDDANGIAQLEADGMIVVRKVDAAAFVKALEPANAAYAKEFGAENIQKIRDYK